MATAFSAEVTVMLWWAQNKVQLCIYTVIEIPSHFCRYYVHMESPTVSVTTWEQNKGQAAIRSGFVVICKDIFDFNILT